ncbi:hypothetical protein [Nocardia huaxiensis]|uniref:Ribbon-helix-helix protein, CopG family n=1 Tax=Nocardia huaxiensis TaxID=2755382 RepID=A0A7D6ZKY7_9NOCA|nr:hypothetical protein [Nocardia huaxiensis]QLY33719.1 hypothetical protein H0264_17100 [Nocardia huaxiensis]UFS99358.1 hypothetical protein LPY97_16420 [Nocardia huaxiensis]
MATKVTVLLPDELAVRLKKVAGEGKQSEYIARAVRQRILEDDLRKLAAFEAERGGPDTSFTREGSLPNLDD